MLYVGKVISASKTKYKVHWSAKKLDGTWSEDYLKPKKGSKARHGGPYTGSIWHEAALDTLPELRERKKGCIDKKQLDEILKLAKAYKKKK